MTHVRAELGQSERRVCRVLGQARSTQRYRAAPREGEAALVKWMRELVRLHPRRGYRMIWGMLRLEGWRVNLKRIYRLSRREGLCSWPRGTKSPPSGPGTRLDTGCQRL